MIKILNYIIYIVLAVYIAFLVYRKTTFSLNKKINHLSAEEAYKLIKKNKNLLIIDVRTTQEYKSGHIQGSKSFPVREIASRITDLKKYKEQPILVYCASGGRSPSAVRVLLKNDFNNIYHMKRGLLGWPYGLK
ncbi:MAG: rhodanese-like domain-containing protein [Eubacteriales bacterium]